MKVRKRAFPIVNDATRDAVAAGKITDPRKGPKSGRGNHAPKMRTNSDPRPTLHTRSEVS
jgi:hypothetical protein